MTTELTKAAQQALEALKLCYAVVEYPANGTSRQDKAIAALERALTQRPAAQTEREAFEAEMRCEETWGHRSLRKHVDGRYQNWMVDALWTAWQARASLPAPQQATPATPEDMKVYDGIAAGYFADTQQATPEPYKLCDGMGYVDGVGDACAECGGQVATPEPVGEPVARVELMQTGGNAGLATRIVEIDDPLRERLRPGDLLFTHPAPGVPEWQPIETAPKDGRDLILLLTPSGFPQVTYSNTWWQSGLSVECRPTGWMPLPAHPLAAAQAKGGQP